MASKQNTELRNQILKMVEQFAKEVCLFDESAGSKSVPVSGKVLAPDDYVNLVDASLDGWLTTGRFNRKFERELARFLNVNHAITVNSGSSANLVAFATLTSPKLKERAIKKGDEVITVAAGFPTTVNPIVQMGAVPVFVDIDIGTHNIDPDLIESAITSKTKAIVLAHTLGNPFNARRVKQICENYGLWLVEDCCDALGAEYGGQGVGTFGDVATLSFYPAHHITTGEGGCVFTQSKELKVIAESYRDWGRDCYCPPGVDNTCGKRFCNSFENLPDGYDHKYVYSHLGYNLKMTDMQAAIGLSQLSKASTFIDKRRSNFEYLSEKMEEHNLGRFFDFVKIDAEANPSWFGFMMTIKPDIKVARRDVISYLDSKKIGTRLLFAGNITRQPYFKELEHRVSGSLHNTDLAMRNSFWVGLFPGLKPRQLDYIVETLGKFFKQRVQKRAIS